MKFDDKNYFDSEGTIIRRRIRNWNNFNVKVDVPDSPVWEESCTVPDMVLSISQILERHKRGVPVASNASFYDSELPAFERMDKFDIADAARANAELIAQHQAGVENAKKKRKADIDAANAKELEELKAFKAKHSADPSTPPNA